jgi:hypothetical protein
MYYTIAEVAEKVGISKSAVYKKIKTNELKPYLSKKQGITYIDETGLKLVQSGINAFVNECTEIETETLETGGNREFKPENTAVESEETNSNKYITHLEVEVDRLWAELQEKNNQIEKLSELVENSQQLVENSQVLLREQPKQNIQLLEEHCLQTDEKIIQVREKMQAKQEDRETEQHESFWSRLFGNK